MQARQGPVFKESCAFQGLGVEIDLVILHPRILLNIVRGPPIKSVCLLVDLCLRCRADVFGICLAEKIPCGGKCSCCVG